MSDFYRKKVEAALMQARKILPADLYLELEHSYRCVYQETRTEVCDELKCRSQDERERDVEQGRIQGMREVVRKILGDEDFSKVFDE